MHVLSSDVCQRRLGSQMKSIWHSCSTCLSALSSSKTIHVRLSSSLSSFELMDSSSPSTISETWNWILHWRWLMLGSFQFWCRRTILLQVLRVFLQLRLHGLTFLSSSQWVTLLLSHHDWRSLFGLWHPSLLILHEHVIGLTRKMTHPADSCRWVWDHFLAEDDSFWSRGASFLVLVKDHISVHNSNMAGIRRKRGRIKMWPSVVKNNVWGADLPWPFLAEMDRINLWDVNR